MHIRNGDYKHHMKVMFNLSLVDYRYFDRAWKYFKRKESVVVVVVVDVVVVVVVVWLFLLLVLLLLVV